MAEVSIATDDTDSPSNVGTRSGVAPLDGPNPRPPTYDKRQDKARKKRESCHCVAWHRNYQGLRPAFGSIRSTLHIPALTDDQAGIRSWRRLGVRARLRPPRLVRLLLTMRLVPAAPTSGCDLYGR